MPKRSQKEIEQFEQAKKEGLSFKKRTQDLLKKQGRLEMLDPIAAVSDWTESIIQKRTTNILELAWGVDSTLARLLMRRQILI